MKLLKVIVFFASKNSRICRLMFSVLLWGQRSSSLYDTYFIKLLLEREAQKVFFLLLVKSQLVCIEFIFFIVVQTFVSCFTIYKICAIYIENWTHHILIICMETGQRKEKSKKQKHNKEGKKKPSWKKESKSSQRKTLKSHIDLFSNWDKVVGTLKSIICIWHPHLGNPTPQDVVDKDI